MAAGLRFAARRGFASSPVDGRVVRRPSPSGSTRDFRDAATPKVEFRARPN